MCVYVCMCVCMRVRERLSFDRARALSLCGRGSHESGYEDTFKVAEYEDTFIVVLLVMRHASAESVG